MSAGSQEPSQSQQEASKPSDPDASKPEQEASRPMNLDIDPQQEALKPASLDVSQSPHGPDTSYGNASI